MVHSERDALWPLELDSRERVPSARLRKYKKIRQNRPRSQSAGPGMSSAPLITLRYLFLFSLFCKVGLRLLSSLCQYIYYTTKIYIQYYYVSLWHFGFYTIFFFWFKLSVFNLNICWVWRAQLYKLHITSFRSHIACDIWLLKNKN